jgi:ABC-2 type transport system ATP-binding protein
MTTPLLEVRDVHMSYGPIQALDGVSFDVAPGEMFGLLGPNGAGKTTLLSILSGLLKASRGEVRLLGEVVTPGNRAVRPLLGIVPQELAVYEELTARENLVFFGELYDLGGAELTQRVDAILAAVGLSQRADSRVRTFSGGMKRRLNLACAMVHQPRLLLLDEPTVGVDPQSRSHIFDEVRRLNAEGTTIVYTSHYMEEVQALCPRIGIIDEGRLRACDTLPNLLKELEGMIRFRVRELPAALRTRIEQMPDVRLMKVQKAVHVAGSAQDSTSGQEAAGPQAVEAPTDAVTVAELRCRDVQATVVQLIAAINATEAELVGLEIEEPNLERVFLHLTGRALRD